MIIRLVLPGSIRSKKNSKRPVQVGKKGNKRLMLIPSKAYMAWEKQARLSIMGQIPVRVKAFAGPVHVCAVVYYKGQRPDLSGAMESIGDCLEGIIYENDRQIESWDGTRLFHDLKNPRTEIIVKEIEE